MRKLTALLLAALCCLGFAACNKVTRQEDLHFTQGEAVQTQPDGGKDEETMGEPVQQDIELVGPWHLAEETNAIFDVFPGAMEFGSTMEIRSNGAIAWYIGADGGAGTYSVDGSVLHCELTNAMDNSPMTMDFTAKRQDGQLFLTTVYRDMELCWRWGEGEAGKG